MNTRYTGVYKARLINGNCSAFSNSIVVSNSIEPLRIYSDINNIECKNQLATIYLGFRFIWPPDNPSFEWKLNGEVISNGTNRWLNISLPGTYTVGYNHSGCIGESLPFVFNSNEVPNPPIIENIFVNYGQPASLNALGCDGLVNWYNSASGGNSIFTGTTLNTPVIDFKTIFYADCQNENCNSILRKKVVVSICESYTIKSGDWDDPTVWSCGQIPNFNTSPTIKVGHNVTVKSGTKYIRNLILNGNIVFENAGEIFLLGEN